MILQLIWKEWREHWPKAATIFLMYLAFMIACAFADRRHALELFLDALRIISFGAAIFMAMSTIISEERARTRSTLASLPIDPRHVFYIKTVADILSLLAPLVIVQFLANAFLSRGPNAIIFPAMAPMTIASTSLYLWVAVLAIRQRTEVRVILVGITILLVSAALDVPPNGPAAIPLLDQIFSTVYFFRLTVVRSFGFLSLLTPLAAMKFGVFPLSDFSFWAELVITFQALVGLILVFVGGDRYKRLVSEGGATKKPHRPSSRNTQISTVPISAIHAVNWKTWRDIRWYISAFILFCPLAAILLLTRFVRYQVNEFNTMGFFEFFIGWAQVFGLPSLAEPVTSAGLVLAALIGVQIGGSDYEGRIAGFWQSRAIDTRRYFHWRYTRGLWAVLLALLMPLALIAALTGFLLVAQWDVGVGGRGMTGLVAAQSALHIAGLNRALETVASCLLYFTSEIILIYSIAVFLGAFLRRPVYAMTLAIGIAALIGLFTEDAGAFPTLRAFFTSGTLGCVTFNVTLLLLSAAIYLLAAKAFTADWLARFQSWFESQRLITR